MPFVILNGELVNESAVSINISDRGFLYGESVFTTIRVYQGYPLALAKHCNRINTTLASSLFALSLRLDPVTIRLLTAQLVKANHCHEGVLRIRVTGGIGAGVVPQNDRSPVTLITLSPLPDLTPIPQGLRLAQSQVVRGKSHQLGRHKLGNYLESILARRQALAQGADEGVIMDPKGNALECSTANLFAVVNGFLITPTEEECILPGITRSLILERARAVGLPIHLAPLTPNIMANAEEMFITNSVLEVVPVSAMGEKTFFPLPGPITRRVQEEYAKLNTEAALAEEVERERLSSATPEPTGPAPSPMPAQKPPPPGREQRQTPRFHIAKEITVLDLETKTVLGRLMNISREGMLLVGLDELTAPKDYYLQLLLPLETGGNKPVDLFASCVHTSIIAGQFYGAGFRFLNPCDNCSKMIELAINTLSDREV